MKKKICHILYNILMWKMCNKLQIWFFEIENASLEKS